MVRGDRVLLIEKHRGLGSGKINAPGGRLEPGETPEAAAVREVEEEVLIRPTGVTPVGELQFQFVSGLALHVYVFRASGYTGVPGATDEATPCWWDRGSLPWQRMWEDDAIWVPLLLRNQPFAGRFVFDGDRMVQHRVELRDVARFRIWPNPPPADRGQ